ncbi:class I glutamine amidotransferase-like protein [Xylariaceae sp. FL1272]|nr:class I glutamine amidotransferase-like protein [Xylariaceae sp. FL1272]
MARRCTPLRLGVVLFPMMSALDVFGPLNALNVHSIKYPMTLSLLSIDMQPVSIDRTIVDGVASGSLMNSSSPYFAQFINPTHIYADSPELDMVLVPGGPGTRDLNRTQPIVDWLREYATLDKLEYVMTVCTGTSLIARSGNIAGRNATTNKAAYNWVTTVEGADKVDWIPKARWVVDDNLWTSSGVSAGTDMTLSWIEHVAGHDESERVRINMEWNPLNRTEDPFAALYGLS